MSTVYRLLPHSCTRKYLSFSSISLLLQLICSFSLLLCHLLKFHRDVCQGSFSCLSLLHTLRCDFKDAFIHQIRCCFSIPQLSSGSNLPSHIFSSSLTELMIHLLRKNSRNGIEKLFHFRYRFRLDCILLHFFFVSYWEIF